MTMLKLLKPMRRVIIDLGGEMTCPVCGRLAMPLVTCQGCGDNAWGEAWALAHGPDIRDRLRTRFKAALTNPEHLADLAGKWETNDLAAQWGGPPTFTERHINQAAQNTYVRGGCFICPACRRHTVAGENAQLCPLRLLAERSVGDKIPAVLRPILAQASHPQRAVAAMQRVMKKSWRRWTKMWNPGVTPSERATVEAWRDLLLRTIWKPAPDEWERRK